MTAGPHQRPDAEPTAEPTAAPDAEPDAEPTGVTALVDGDVQGVGFRWWVRTQARELGLAGYARNLLDGRVEVCAQGPAEAVARLETLLSERPSTARRPGRVDSVQSRPSPVRTDLSGFDAV